MIRILFLCHGNICRSVAAQYVMEQMIREAGLEDVIEVDSAAATTEEIGNPVYPPMRKALEARGVPIGTHRARLMTMEDYETFDYLIGMDYENLRDLQDAYGESGAHRISGRSSFRFDGRIKPDDPDQKISLLLDYTDAYSGEISDPWYTRDFDGVCEELEAGCRGLLDFLTSNLPGEK